MRVSRQCSMLIKTIGQTVNRSGALCNNKGWKKRWDNGQYAILVIECSRRHLFWVSMTLSQSTSTAKGLADLLVKSISSILSKLFWNEKS